MNRLSWYLKVFGFQGLLLAFCAAVFKKSIKLKVYSGLLGGWVTIRTKTSDLAVFEKVLVNEEYLLPDWVIPQNIIDAGANIGLSALYFSTRYPNARVFAIEPEAANFALLCENVKTCQNIIPIKGAIWNKCEPIKLTGYELSYCGFQVERCDSESDIFGMTIDEIMNKNDLNYIEVLKIDIEGAEKEVFESASNWIEKINLIVIELHEQMKPGCVRAVQNATLNFEKAWVSGENNFYSRRR
ncbi:MAG: FkbM family methyltransferase [Deltaproteobacteria bacterium]